MGDIGNLDPSSGTGAAFSSATLREVTAFGSNPGALKMWMVSPKSGTRRRPVVVVLHGCRQAAAGFDSASGWSLLATDHDFLVLYPEQQPANNRQCCFSWFQPDDTRRGRGEVESIRQMIETVIATHGADPDAVFVCGLSAGGAMAGAMLAVYPELFRGGAIIAGLPYGTASGLAEAYESMSAGKIKDAKVWGDLVRAASDHEGPWPSIAIWHGADDKIVKPINAGELVKQWTNVHGIGASVPAEDHIGRVIRRSWLGAGNRAKVIDYAIPGFGHGAPVADRDPPAPFFLPAGISSTWHIARDWGLTERARSRSLLESLGF